MSILTLSESIILLAFIFCIMKARKSLVNLLITLIIILIFYIFYESYKFILLTENQIILMKQSNGFPKKWEKSAYII